MNFIVHAFSYNSQSKVKIGKSSFHQSYIKFYGFDLIKIQEDSDIQI